MGMYQDVQFETELNEVGLEVWADLAETRCWTMTASRLPYYGFLELVERMGKWIHPLPIWPGVVITGPRLRVDTRTGSALKDRGGDLCLLLQTFLGPLVDKSFAVRVDHDLVGLREFRVEPTALVINWDRRYGDPV